MLIKLGLNLHNQDLTKNGRRLRAFLQAPHRHLRVLGVLPFRNQLGSVGDRLDVVETRGVLAHLLVLGEGEPDVHGADVEEEGDGDVEDTEQHHQLTGPVEEAEADRGVSGHPGAASPEGEPSVKSVTASWESSTESSGSPPNIRYLLPDFILAAVRKLRGQS